MKLEHSLTPYTKIYSKWIKDLNIRPDTIKLLEENIGRTLYDINHSKIPFYPPPREMEIKTKRNKWVLMKFRSFCTAKETINKMKRQPSKWEKIFANEATEKGLIFQNIQGACAAQYLKNKQKIQKWTEDVNRHFSKEDINFANKHMKGCSTSLMIREMQIKTTMRYHLTQVKMAIIKNLQTRNAGEGVEKRDPSYYTLGGNVN